MSFDLMETVKIPSDMSKREFFVTDTCMFVLITGLNERNQICVFDDDLTDKAREYADENTPELNVSYSNRDKFGFVNKERIEYWSKLFHFFIWEWLEKNNTICFMKSP